MIDIYRYLKSIKLMKKILKIGFLRRIIYSFLEILMSSVVNKCKRVNKFLKVSKSSEISDLRIAMVLFIKVIGMIFLKPAFIMLKRKKTWKYQISFA